MSRKWQTSAFAVALTIFLFVKLTAGYAQTQSMDTFYNHQSKPNIIFILVDDMGWKQLGSYGSEYYETPNIDRLAKQGMRFTDAYAATVCSPTRAAIMTGEYPARTHMTNWMPGHPMPFVRLKAPNWQKYLPLHARTIAEALHDQDYRTAIFGKWHLSQAKLPPRSLPYNPDKQGFDENFVTYKPAAKYAQPWQATEDDPHNVDTLTTRAIQFMQINKHQPFFLYLPHNTIHEPIVAHQKIIKKYQNKTGADKPENNPVLGAMIQSLDKSTGRIMAAVKRLGLENNTIIIFYSDNGGELKSAKQTPLLKGKGWLYEGGIRVPLIVRWPGVVKPGSVSHQMVHAIDFYPTFLKILSVTPKKNLDGVSILPVLTDNEKLKRNTLYWNFPHYNAYSGGVPADAIREGNYKLIEWYRQTLTHAKDQIELYNLKNDIGEQNNLVKKMPQKALEMRRKLIDWRYSVGAQMPSLNPEYIPEKEGVVE